MQLDRLEKALFLMQAQARIIGKRLTTRFSGLGQEQNLNTELLQIRKEIKSQALQPECEAIFEFALHLNVPILNLSKKALTQCHFGD